MTKIVYNACYGGFSLSVEAKNLYLKRKGVSVDYISEWDIDRADPDLVTVVEELGSENASGFCAELKIVDLIPGTLYRITEYDGSETVETKDNIDWKVA